jgi:hypothetical protein
MNIIDECLFIWNIYGTPGVSYRISDWEVWIDVRNVHYLLLLLLLLLVVVVNL